MLTIRETLPLSTARPVMHVSLAFCERITANYDTESGGITGEELLHLLSEPVQLWVQEGGQLEVNNIFQDNRNLNVMNTVNQILNRILMWNHAEFTYQDQVYVERKLRRLGIRQVSDFLGQMKETLDHCGEIFRLKGNYENWGNLIRETVEGLRELQRPRAKEDGEKWKVWEAGKYDTAGMLYRDIYRRLDTRKIYEEVLRFNRCQVNHNLSGNRTDQVFRLAEYERPLLWLKMSEAGESVLGGKQEIVPQMNPYELVHGGKIVQSISSSGLWEREKAQEQMISAILVNLAEQARIFELEHGIDAAMKQVWNHVGNNGQKPVQDYGMAYIHTDEQKDTTKQSVNIRYEWTDFRYAFRETAINTLKRFEGFHREGRLATEHKREMQREIYRLQAEEETFLALLHRLLEMERTEAIEAESCGTLAEKAGKLILDWRKEWGEDKKEDGNKWEQEDYRSRFEVALQKLEHDAGREKMEERTGEQKEDVRLERRDETVTKYRTEQARSSKQGQNQVWSQNRLEGQNQGQFQNQLEGQNQEQFQSQLEGQNQSQFQNQLEGQNQEQSGNQLESQNQDRSRKQLESQKQDQPQNQFISELQSRFESQEQPYDLEQYLSDVLLKENLKSVSLPAETLALTYLEQLSFPEEYIRDGNKDSHSVEAAEKRLETEVIISNVHQEKSAPWHTIPLAFLENDIIPEESIRTEVQKLSELSNTDIRQEATHRDYNIHSVKELLTRQIEAVARRIKAIEVRRQQLLLLSAGRSLEDQPSPGIYEILMKEGPVPAINQYRQTKESLESMQNEQEHFWRADMELRPGQTGKNEEEIFPDLHFPPEIKVQKEILAAARLAAKLLAGGKSALLPAKTEVTGISIVNHQSGQMVREQSALFREHIALFREHIAIVRERAAIARETTDSSFAINSLNRNSVSRNSVSRNSVSRNSVSRNSLNINSLNINGHNRSNPNRNKPNRSAPNINSLNIKSSNINSLNYEAVPDQPTMYQDEIFAEIVRPLADINLDAPIAETSVVPAAEDSKTSEKYKEIKAYLDEVNKQNMMKYQEISEKQILPVSEETRRTPDMKKIRELSKLALADPVKMMEHLKKLPDTPATGIEPSNTLPPVSKEEREKRQQLEVILRQADDTTRYIVEQIWNYRADGEAGRLPSKARPASQIQLVSDLNRIVEENQREVTLINRENAESVVKSMAAGIHGVSDQLVTRWNRTEEGVPGREDTPGREVPIVYRQRAEQITEELLEKLLGKREIHINQSGKSLTGAFTPGRSVPGVSGSDRSGSSIFNSMSVSFPSGESFTIPQTGGIKQTEVIKNRTAKELQELIEKGITKQMGMISDKVYQKLEKKLESEMTRRGR